MVIRQGMSCRAEGGGMAGVSVGRSVMMARLTGGDPASPLVRRQHLYPACKVGERMHVLSGQSI